MLFQLLLRLWNHTDDAMNVSRVESYLNALCPATMSTEQAHYVIGWFLFLRDGEEKVKKLSGNKGIPELVISFAQNFLVNEETGLYHETIPSILESGEEQLTLHKNV